MVPRWEWLSRHCRGWVGVWPPGVSPEGKGSITMSTSTVTVTGMTCGHCASSVREQISTLDGVTNVAVDVASGQVTIDSSAPLERDAIRSAGQEAGYQLAE